MRLLASTFLWLFSTFSSIKGNNIEADCVTPISGLGKCIEVRYCVSIMTALVNNDHLTNPKVAKYLRESQCGIQRNSQKVCCDVTDIDFGDETGVDSTTSRVRFNEPSPSSLKPLSDIETCGKVNDRETPLKWVGELWFKFETFSKTTHESKCLGTLISYKHLVVPAHCVASLPVNVTLDFVEILGNEFYVSKIFIHASYNQPKFANDIAIIELDRETEVEINDAICLPESLHEVKSSIAVVKRAGGVLKFGKAQLISANDCSSFFNQQFTELTAGQFCSNVQSNDTSAAFIGGILIESDKSMKYTLKGFTSTAIRTEQAFDESKPYVFTDLAHHLSWIRAAVGADLIRKEKPSRIVEPSRNLNSCQIPNGNGLCVQMYQCSLYRDAPKETLTRQREAFLDQIKCYTALQANRNSLNEDGICCPEKYIQLNFTEQFGVRFEKKSGVDFLDKQKCGQVASSRRIVGGTKADLKEFPWIGLIKYKLGRIFKFTCGSSLISNKYVLTCAHCITSLPPGYEVVAVRLGEYDRTTDPDCKYIDEINQECNPPAQDIKVGKLIPHPDYNTPRYANDVGLIRLSKIPDLTQGVIPICLPINEDMLKTLSQKYTVAGFGFTENGRDSDVLLKVVLPKVSKETCQSFHSSMIQLSEGQECYGGEGVRDSCKGDSGNPLMNYVNIKGRIKAVQLGIVTAGHSDCGRGASGFPGIYSDVKHYLSWILSQFEE